MVKSMCCIKTTHTNLTIDKKVVLAYNYCIEFEIDIEIKCGCS